MTTGEKIKRMRNECGITQKQLADMIGSTQQQIGQWENGVRDPKMTSLRRIAEAFDCPMTDFLPDYDAQPSIGAAIRIRRHARHMTQQDLANAASVNVQTIRSYESDKYHPKNLALRKLAAALACPVSVLDPTAVDAVESESTAFCPVLNAPCCQGHCAWWNAEHSACAVAVLAALEVLS